MGKIVDWKCTRCLALKSEWLRISHPGRHPSCVALPNHACPMLPVEQPSWFQRLLRRWALL